MRVIGIGHRARQGKDTLARYLVMEFAKKGLYAKQYAFADALRAVCNVNFDMVEKNGKLLQLVGTDLYRNFVSEDIWVNILRQRIQDENPDVAIITDTRFPNEWYFVKGLGGYTIRVQRYSETGLYIPTDRDPNHPSETALQDFDFDYDVINNSGNIVGLEDSAVAFVDWLDQKEYDLANREDDDIPF